MNLHKALFVGLVAATLALSGCTAPGDDEEQNTELVRMTDELKFDPVELTIEPGTEVVWRNVGNIPHTVTSNDAGGPLESGNVGGAGTYRFTFDEPGIYEYHCEPHAFQNEQGEYEGMIGTVVVLNEDGSRPTESPVSTPEDTEGAGGDNNTTASA